MQTRRRWPKISRDSILFTTGLVLVLNEALLHTGPDRPSLLILFGGMMGLPALLRYDERRRDRDEE